MAVYTYLDAGEIARIAERYRIAAPVIAHPIAKGVENSNYRLEAADGSRHILTLYEARTRVEDVPFFLALTEHLAGKELPVPRPRRTADGEATIVTQAGKTAAVVEFLPGEETGAITPAQCAALGELLARLHGAVADFPGRRANDLSLAGWRRIVRRNRGRFDAIRPGLEAEIETELAYLAAAWPKRLPRGVVHLDLFPDNVFFDGDRLSGAIDFYFAAVDHFLYDLAIAYNAWCFDPGGFYPDRAGALLGAYHARRPRSTREAAAWPILLRGAALRFLLTRAHDWLNPQAGALVVAKDPLAYREILEFHRRAE